MVFLILADLLHLNVRLSLAQRMQPLLFDLLRIRKTEMIAMS